MFRLASSPPDVTSKVIALLKRDVTRPTSQTERGNKGTITPLEKRNFGNFTFQSSEFIGGFKRQHPRTLQFLSELKDLIPDLSRRRLV